SARSHCQGRFRIRRRKLRFENKVQRAEEPSQTFRGLACTALQLIEPRKTGRELHDLEKTAKGHDGGEPQTEIHRQIVSDAIRSGANHEKGACGRVDAV